MSGFFAAHITQKKPLISKHLNEIGKNFDLLLYKYDNFMLMGDLNAEPTEVAVSDFCEIYNLKHLIKEKTCFKNPTKPTCIDLTVTNRPKFFQDTVVLETKLSDFHNVSATVMKMYYTNQKFTTVISKTSVTIPLQKILNNFC